jgi:hypothetical protein
VVLRKDMSLNRRLYAWIMGPDQKLDIFHREVLVKAMKKMFYTESTDMAEIAKPYKVLLSLLDKTEVGNPLLERLIVDILMSWKQKDYQTAVNRHEV